MVGVRHVTLERADAARNGLGVREELCLRVGIQLGPEADAVARAGGDIIFNLVVEVRDPERRRKIVVMVLPQILDALRPRADHEIATDHIVDFCPVLEEYRVSSGEICDRVSDVEALGVVYGDRSLKRRVNRAPAHVRLWTHVLHTVKVNRVAAQPPCLAHEGPDLNKLQCHGLCARVHNHMSPIRAVSALCHGIRTPDANVPRYERHL
mmetsp:Transcript_2067/g.6696  ORF Transcript_2067/g.6696 Transcript_2067/m.6696 type:complete len:209 (+) Transcript_2067:1816-2442(+)